MLTNSKNRGGAAAAGIRGKWRLPIVISGVQSETFNTVIATGDMLSAISMSN